MPTMQIHIRSVPHADERPTDDDAEGERLVQWVRQAVAGRRAPPAAVVLRPERTDLVDLGPIARAGIQVPRMIAGLGRSEIADAGTAYAVGLIGVIEARRRGTEEAPGVPMAVVFLEWPDNRWWYWKALVDADGSGLRPGTEVVQRAVQGDAMPEIFGRWWALARRENLKLQLTKVPIVH